MSTVTLDPMVPMVELRVDMLALMRATKMMLPRTGPATSLVRLMKTWSASTSFPKKAIPASPNQGGSDVPENTEDPPVDESAARRFPAACGERPLGQGLVTAGQKECH